MMSTSVNYYQIHPGALHLGGKASTQVQTLNGESTLKISFQIEKKKLVAIPHRLLTGNYQIQLPSNFQSEKGYLELEKLSEMNFPKYKIHHLGRRSLFQWKDAHLIEVISTNGKARGEILYHPKAPGHGWIEIKIFLHLPIPFLDNYTLSADLINKAEG